MPVEMSKQGLFWNPSAAHGQEGWTSNGLSLPGRTTAGRETVGSHGLKFVLISYRV